MQTAAAAALSWNGRVWELVDRECGTSSLSVCGCGFGGVKNTKVKQRIQPATGG